MERTNDDTGRVLRVADLIKRGYGRRYIVDAMRDGRLRAIRMGDGPTSPWATNEAWLAEFLSAEADAAAAK